MGNRGQRGHSELVGFAVPQANPTVERELRRLAPASVDPIVTRLVSGSESPAERLRDYWQGIGAALSSFDRAPIRALGVACTGSSYLAGAEHEAETVEALSREGVPVITACGAIMLELARLGARCLAVLAPYPEWLAEAAAAYWGNAGFELVALRTIPLGSPDTRRIYNLTSDDARRALEAFDTASADAVLLSGTGMPTVDALAWARERLDRPVISSNLCLFAEVFRRAGAWDADLSANELLGVQAT